MLLPQTRPLRFVAGMQLLTVAAGLMAAALALRVLAAIGWRGMVAAFVVLDLDRHAPHQRFGAANSVTLARAALTALLWGVVGETMLGARDLDESLHWLLVVAATGALLLDGVDGWIARRNGMTSRFGADFDMEVDCLFMLALALLVYGTGRVGIWVLGSGLMRYLFVVAGWFQPMLAAPLKPLRRRKVICAVQGAVLIAALAPILPAEVVPPLCLAGLALLTYSFGADVRSLAKARGR